MTVKIYRQQDDGCSAVNSRRYYCANSLFNGSKEVFILHGDKQYRLSVTRQGKLILTK